MNVIADTAVNTTHQPRMGIQMLEKLTLPENTVPKKFTTKATEYPTAI